MLRNTPRAAVAITALIAVVAFTTPVSAAAGSHPAIVPHEFFKATVNGSAGEGGPVRISMTCAGPSTTGHPAGGRVDQARSSPIELSQRARLYGGQRHVNRRLLRRATAGRRRHDICPLYRLSHGATANVTRAPMLRFRARHVRSAPESPAGTKLHRAGRVLVSGCVITLTVVPSGQRSAAVDRHRDVRNNLALHASEGQLPKLTAQAP